jgi:Isochorismatase family
MSAFEDTFLNAALRDLGINSFAVCGITTEVGIEPTVRCMPDRRLHTGGCRGRVWSGKYGSRRALAGDPEVRRGRHLHRLGDDRHPLPLHKLSITPIRLLIMALNRLDKLRKLTRTLPVRQ